MQRFLMVSTAYVAGQRSGDILEEELDCGQNFVNHYEESSYTGQRYEIPDGSICVGGGLASIDDIRRLLKPRYQKLEGAISGRALYDGRIDPKEALALIAAHQN